MQVTLNEPAHQTLFDALIGALDVFQRIYMRLSSYVSPERQCRTIFGAIVRCRTRQFIERRIRYFGIFEHNLTYYTISKLKTGDVYLDIGANIGYYTLLSSSCVGPSGQVISIEADPDTFRDLEANIRLNNYTNITAKNVAATEFPGRVSISRVAGNSGENTIQKGPGDIMVDGVPFKDLAGDKINRIKFIKIDIEGSEEPILRSIIANVDNLAKDVVVASEVSPASAAHVEGFIRSGFRAFAIGNIYTIDYYLIQSYLSKKHNCNALDLVPVTGYDPLYRDYVFERI